jgi:agmatine/peptidylarginine deiminase
MTKNLCFLICSMLPMVISAQMLPHNFAPGEQAQMPAYRIMRSAQVGAPPASPVRTIAEWEELQGLTITWTSYQSILREIVRYAKQETRVYIICSNPSAVTSYLAAGNIDTVNVTCLQIPYNSVWSRDYGLWSGYTNDVDSLVTLDWIYNRPRPLDDAVPEVMAGYLGTPFYETTTPPWDLVHTGGNFMTDGFGTGFSSKLILDENPNKTEAEIDTVMHRFMGINRYIKMDKLPYDVIHHIDMHMKLLDEETILFGEYPTGVSDGPQIEANMLYVLNNFNSVFGTPYKILRIPMPADNNQYPATGGDYFTYTNSSFINKTIIVPTYNIPSDSIALGIYREALPGYTVAGINSLASIGALGALHCITKEIGTSDPLLISHKPLADTYDDQNPYTVSALIKHRSGILNATIYYRTDTLQPYTPVIMFPSGGFVNWIADIPPMPVGTDVYYYVEANSNSGKHQVRPLPAPVGYWKFRVLGTVSSGPGMSSATIDRVFPNPSRGITCIEVSSDTWKTGRITVTDITGRMVAEVFQGEMRPGVNRYFIDTQSFQTGVYGLILQAEGKSGLRKLIVR